MKILVLIFISILGFGEGLFTSEINSSLPYLYFDECNETFVEKEFAKICEKLKATQQINYVGGSYDFKIYKSTEDFDIEMQFGLAKASLGYIDARKAKAIDFYLAADGSYQLQNFRYYHYSEGLKNALKDNDLRVDGKLMISKSSLEESKLPALMIRREADKIYACWNNYGKSADNGKVKAKELYEKYKRDVTQDLEIMNKEIRNSYPDYTMAADDRFYKYDNDSFKSEENFFFKNRKNALLSLTEYLKKSNEYSTDLWNIFSWFGKNEIVGEDFSVTDYGIKYDKPRQKIGNNIESNYCAMLIKSLLLKHKNGKTIEFLYNFDGIKSIKVFFNGEQKILVEFDSIGKIIN